MQQSRGFNVDDQALLDQSRLEIHDDHADREVDRQLHDQSHHAAHRRPEEDEDGAHDQHILQQSIGPGCGRAEKQASHVAQSEEDHAGSRANRDQDGVPVADRRVQSDDRVRGLLRGYTSFFRDFAVSTMLGQRACKSRCLRQLRGERVPVSQVPSDQLRREGPVPVPRLWFLQVRQVRLHAHWKALLRRGPDRERRRSKENSSDDQHPAREGRQSVQNSDLEQANVGDVADQNIGTSAGSRLGGRRRGSGRRHPSVERKHSGEQSDTAARAEILRRVQNLVRRTEQDHTKSFGLSTRARGVRSSATRPDHRQLLVQRGERRDNDDDDDDDDVVDGNDRHYACDNDDHDDGEQQRWQRRVQFNDEPSCTVDADDGVLSATTHRRIRESANGGSLLRMRDRRHGTLPDLAAGTRHQSGGQRGSVQAGIDPGTGRAQFAQGHRADAGRGSAVAVPRHQRQRAVHQGALRLVDRSNHPDASRSCCHVGPVVGCTSRNGVAGCVDSKGGRLLGAEAALRDAVVPDGV